jgi:hypothetical protein
MSLPVRGSDGNYDFGEYGPVKLKGVAAGVDATDVVNVGQVDDLVAAVEYGTDILVPKIPAVAAQALSGAGAINITSYVTKVTTTGANALTLANGTVVGQLKKIIMVVDAGDGTLTPANLAGGTTITFANAGEYAELMWNGTDWVAIELASLASATAAPVLA